MTARRLMLAALGALLIWTFAVSAAAGLVEVEHYRSLRGMTRAADSVVLGRIVSAAPGRVFSGCGYTDATLEVERVLARRVDVPETTLTIEYFSFCAALPALGNEIPAERGIFFLRNKGPELARLFPNSTDQEIERESHYWRLVTMAGTIVERAGLAHLPSTSNARFLEELEGRPFDDVVREIVRLAPLPATDVAESTVGLHGSPIAPLLVLGLATFVAVLWRQPGKRRGELPQSETERLGAS